MSPNATRRWLVPRTHAPGAPDGCNPGPETDHTENEVCPGVWRHRLGPKFATWFVSPATGTSWMNPVRHSKGLPRCICHMSYVLLKHQPLIISCWNAGGQKYQRVQLIRSAYHHLTTSMVAVDVAVFKDIGPSELFFRP